MTAFSPTGLEKWLENRLDSQGGSLRRLKAFQLEHLNRTLARVQENSPFYRDRLKGGPIPPLTDLAEITGLPFTTPEDVRRHHLEMLCVSHGEVARVVTLQTSGTSSAPKRLYFSEADLELTIDFFHHGMACLVRPGQNVLILLPGKTPDSVGDLLKRGLARIPAGGHVHWPVVDLEDVLENIVSLDIDCLAGAPAQIFALCRYEAGRRLEPNTLKSILLSTDYVPKIVVEEIKKVWGCDVFEHYGMTEMGFGGALHCDAHRGYHLREADLLVEIVDPESGDPLPPGTEGEVVFTTISRQAMPLIRYRTGDRASWLSGPCGCGSVLRRLGKVQGRFSDVSSAEVPLSMPMLDETVFSLPGILSFQAGCRTEDNGTVLDLTLFCNNKTASRLKEEVAQVVGRLLAKRSSPITRINVQTLLPQDLRWDATGMVKRTISK